MTTAPLLSIGMIFKNEERCIERCLKSLESLRRAIPCELIMADTGATDKSREIAARYADEVFDFEWIDDFSAARNAVMNRCTGKWYMSIDCDEWLDADISELTDFVTGRKKVDFAFVIVRNYTSAELEKGDAYSDFRALRLVRMSTGQRYHGAIHESWSYREPAEQLTRTVLHHDGYFFTDPEVQKKKAERNMKLLRQKLKETPDSLMTLLQCIESGSYDADYIQYIRRAAEGVQNRYDGWEQFGGCIMRHVVEIARLREMPELKEWMEFAETQFPDSIFTKVDLNHTAFFVAYNKKSWEEAIRYGEAYQKGWRILHADHLPKKIATELGLSSISRGNPFSAKQVEIGLADCYLHAGKGKQALKTIENLDWKKLDPYQLRNVVVVLCQLHAQTQLDISACLVSFYEQIGQKDPKGEAHTLRLTAFHVIAAAAFEKNYREQEEEREGYWRPAYTAFFVLADRCEAGRGAKIMMSADPMEMRAILADVEDWQMLPIEALEHALAAGVPFPLEEKPLNLEVLDGLAARLTHNDNTARQMALALSDTQEYPTRQSLQWTQSVVLAALRTFDWRAEEKEDKPNSSFAYSKEEKDSDKKPKQTCIPEEGFDLLCRFAQVESALLPLLYTPEVLTEQNAALLPSMHRWGLYCSLAMEALESGQPHEYLSLLRRGLKACPGAKDMVQFLLDRFQEDARPKASPELLALAEKVRTILSAYSPDDPAVAAIRQSPAYQQVAWLIEPEPIDQMIQ